MFITKIFSFEAAHHLPNHQGACHNTHGHSYKLEITLDGWTNGNPASNEYGMIMDFGKLKSIVQKEIIDRFDHQDLNSIFPNPTAENMVDEIADILSEKIDRGNDGPILFSVKLWETSTSYAEWRAE